MYSLTQTDLDTFNNIKANHPELVASNIDVVPVANGVYSGKTFTPDGTYSLDESFFPPKAKDFLTDLQTENFFTNLPAL